MSTIVLPTTEGGEPPPHALAIQPTTAAPCQMSHEVVILLRGPRATAATAAPIIIWLQFERTISLFLLHRAICRFVGIFMGGHAAEGIHLTWDNHV